MDIKAKRTKYERESLGVSQVEIQIRLSDGELSSLTTVTITIESINENPHKGSEKTITVFNYKGLFHNVDLGHVYSEDKDDWDKTEKVYSLVDSHEGFR